MLKNKNKRKEKQMFEKLKRRAMKAANMLKQKKKKKMVEKRTC